MKTTRSVALALGFAVLASMAGGSGAFAQGYPSHDYGAGSSWHQQDPSDQGAWNDPRDSRDQGVGAFDDNRQGGRGQWGRDQNRSSSRDWYGWGRSNRRDTARGGWNGDS